MAHKYQPGDEPIPGSGFRLVEFLGQGGFGEVWKATAPGGAEAALKFIPLGDTGGRKEFRALQLVKRSRHANLIPIIAFWLKGIDGSILDDALTERVDLSKKTPPSSIDKTMQIPDEADTEPSVELSELIIAMGLGDKSLFDRLQECRTEGLQGIPVDELLGYMEGAARAIDFLNSPTHDLGTGADVGIQHCDIKPQNLMIVGGVTQICDFGLAQMIGADRTTTAAASIAYAAPECLVTGKPSESTDQYSLAVSYSELRTGVLPYENETLGAVMDAKRQGTLDYSLLSEAEQAVLRRATSHRPADRFANAMEMVEALRSTVREAGEAQPKGRLEVVESLYRDTVDMDAAAQPRPRRSAVLATIGLIVVLLAGAGIGAWRAGLLARIFPENHPPAIDESPDLQATQGRPVTLSLAFTDPDVDDTHTASVDWGDGTDGIGGVAESNGRGTVTASHVYNAGGIYLVRVKVADDTGGLGTARATVTVEEPAIPPEPEPEPEPPQPEPPQPEPAERVAEMLVRAKAAVDRDEFDRAIGVYTEAVGLLPSNVEARLGRGRCYLKLKRYDEAIADLDQLDPQQNVVGADLAEAYLARGTQLLEDAEFDKAVADFDRAAAHNPKDARVFSRRGAAWFQQQQWDKAAASFTAAIELDPNDTDYTSRGRAYRELGKSDDALADFREAARLNPQNAAAHAALGTAYMEQEDIDRAITSFSEAIRVCSENPDESFPVANAHVLRASSYLMLTPPRFDDAATDFEAALQKGDERDLSRFHALLALLAAAYAEKGQSEKAIRWIGEAIKVAPDEETRQKYRDKLKRYQPPS